VAGLAAAGTVITKAWLMPGWHQGLPPTQVMPADHAIGMFEIEESAGGGL